jgi:hypothetical protein
MAVGSTQPPTEMSTKNPRAGKGQPTRKTNNLTAICKLTVQKMWEPRRLTTLWASTAYYRDSLTFALSQGTFMQFVPRTGDSKSYWFLS